jgi:Domain of unknown function (DUF4345)
VGSLRSSGLLIGSACVLIGLLHAALGTASVPGESADPTVDSRERFYGAVFAGYGVAWVWAARTVPVPVTVVRWLAGVLLAGGLARLVSVGVHGRPHRFQIVLTGIELVLPLPVLWLASVEERADGRQT